MGHKHKLKWKKKKENQKWKKEIQFPTGVKQFINKLCNDNRNVSQIKVKSWKWSFCKAAQYQ